MNIRVQVLANQARRAIAQVQGDITRMAVAQTAASAATSRSNGIMAGGLKGLTSFGNRLQWTGRQLQYNFTLPILAAAAAGAKFQMDNERAMTRVAKVYGDAGMASSTLKNELHSLEGAFEALSEKYGITQKETIGIAAEWAAAGSSGLALAKQTDLTMKTMVLGELNAADATSALIAIQAQYNQSSDELADTIARLNNVENQTGTTMGDLITSFSRAAGVARGAGVDVAHLAAMTAAMTPAAGSAAQAGNALKTIISRLLSPTAEASQILNELGIHVDEMSWKSANASTRIELLSKKYEGLSDSQKAVVSATLASRYQINKFEVLMDAIARKGDAAGNGMSYYWKALAAATNRTEYMAQVTKELNTVLDSNPKKWDRIKVIMQNTLANAVQPMLPALMAFGQMIAEVFRKISDMSPATQKWIGAVLILLVVLPLVTRYLGSLITLFATLAYVVGFVMKPVFLLGRMLSALWGIMRLGWVVSTLLGFAFQGVMLAMGVLASATPLVARGMGMLVGVLPVVAGAIWGVAQALGTGMLWGIAHLLVTPWKAIFTGIGTAILTGMGTVLAGIGAILMPIANVILTWIPVMGAAISRGWTIIAVAFGTIQGYFVNLVVLAWTSMGRILPGLIEGVAIVMVSAWRTAQFAMIYLSQLLGPMLVTIYTTMGTALATLWTGLGTALVAIYRAMGVALTVTSFAITRGLYALWFAFTSAMSAVWAARLALITAITWTWGNVIVPVMTQIGKLIVLALSSPWTWLALAVIAVLYGLRDKIKGAWNATIKWLSDATNAVVNRVIGAFNLLPQGIQNALLAVVRMVKAVALKVYEWFSYLNPFAHHSPSLVENVNNGMAAVVAGFGTLTQIKAPIDNAYASIRRLKLAMGAIGDSLEFADDRQVIAEINPSALASFDSLVAVLTATRVRADALNNAVKAQENVVDAWKAKLDAANDALNQQKDILQDLQDVADGYADQISKLNDEISTLSSTPLTGMKAMEDATFANEMAQKRLRLEMLKAGEQGGQSMDDIRNKVASLAGEIARLTGDRENLRSMGAGSEILDSYDAQINALGDQKKALEGAVAPVNEMQKQLDDLQRQAEIMDLEKSLKFDPLTRQIDAAANAMDEMPFETVISRIKANQAAVDQLEGAHARATAAVEAQQAAVDRAQASVDAIQASYDAESKKLEQIRDLYQEVADAVRDMEGALSDASGAASAVKQAQDDAAGAEGYVSPALQNFRDAAGGDFADVGGSGMVGREGGLGDQSADIDAWTKSLADEAGKAFGDFDMFGPLKDMWKAFVAWWNKNVGPWITAAGDFFTHLFDGVDIFSGLRGKGDAVGGFFKSLWDAIVNVVMTLWDFGKMLWEILGPDVKETLDIVFGFFVDMWHNLQKIWAEAAPMVQPLIEALTNMWNIVKVPLGLMFAWIVAGVQLAWSVINGMLGPVLDWIGGVFMNLWQIVKGFLNFFIGIFTLDFGRAFGGLWDMIKGLWGLIWDTIVSLGAVIIGGLKGLASGLFDGFKWLGGMIIDGLIAGLKWALGKVMDFFSWIGEQIITFVKWIFGINSPSTVFAEIGVWLLQGLINGLLSMLESVYNFFKPMLDDIGGFFKGLWTDYIKPAVDWIMGAWDKLGQAMKYLYDIFIKPYVDLFKNVWNALGDALKAVWTAIIKPSWDNLGAAMQALYNLFIKPYVDLFKQVWTALGDALQAVWLNIIKPAWEALKGAAKGLVDAVVDKFTSMRDTVSDIFTAIRDTAGRIWDGLIEKVKSPIRIVFNWVNGNMIDPVNSLLSKFPGNLQIPHLPQLADGGQVRGPGTGRSDSILGVDRRGVPTSLVSNGEFVVNAKSTRENLGLLHALNRGQKLPGYFLGGLVGGIGDAASWAWDKAGDGVSWVGEKVGDLVAKGGRYAAEHLLKPLVEAAKGLVPGDGIFPSFLRGSMDKLYNAVAGKGDEHDKEAASLAAGTGHGRYPATPNGVGGLGPAALRARQYVIDHFGISNIGGYSYRNVAGTNTLSDHATGHAIDVMIDNYKTSAGISKGNQVASYFVQNPAAFGTKYVIWRKQINEGNGWKAYSHPGGGSNDTLDHMNHVHASLYDQGGIMDGLGVNLTGRPERVLSPRQTISFDRLVDVLDRDGIPSMARMEAAIFRASAKANAAAAIGQQTVIQYQGDTNVTININGDLSFPNITDGDDADVFLQNLGDLAGGRSR